MEKEGEGSYSWNGVFTEQAQEENKRWTCERRMKRWNPARGEESLQAMGRQKRNTAGIKEEYTGTCFRIGYKRELAARDERRRF
ncbi:hypothetical protein LR48_Vigan07g195300 [Vigna angularis]|uniref:Uncharacterized protein n=1 Tax=Phaseolus angularis TaxID=3914 RepID=A0A0L9V0G6_PHAAN|nr:hypothetical protein LR48_Vigan07g195300 [Vigna angularis]